MPICLRLLAHLARLAASRTFWTAGRSRPISTAMMAITTNSSISVNPWRREQDGFITGVTERRGMTARSVSTGPEEGGMTGASQGRVLIHGPVCGLGLVQIAG